MTFCSGGGIGTSSGETMRWAWFAFCTQRDLGRFVRVDFNSDINSAPNRGANLQRHV